MSLVALLLLLVVPVILLMILIFLRVQDHRNGHHI